MAPRTASSNSTGPGMRTVGLSEAAMIADALSSSAETIWDGY